MNYSNHNLRTNLQEWNNRLHRATHDQFGNQLKYFLDNIDNHRQIQALIDDAVKKYYLSQSEFDQKMKSHRSSDPPFENVIHQAGYCYQFLKYFIAGTGNYDLQRYHLFSGRDFDDSKMKILDNYISPILYFLHDKLEKLNSTVYLLEKYKKRVEWFSKNKILETYNSADKSFEKILEDDLRLFLFDQGVDYPFSTPSSASGRADIIGEIETNDPLIIEIKIFDRKKGYGKDRIKDGFTQIVKYANDYNKDVGFLVIFNMDEVEINFNLSDKTKVFPPSLVFNSKTYYLIVINCGFSASASKIGTTTEVEVREEELTNK